MTFNLIAICPNDPYHVAVIHILGVGDRNLGIGHQYFSITDRHQRISQFAFSGEEGWATVNPVKGFENAVTCNCSFSNATVCYVVSISLIGNRLTGSIPKALVNISTLTSLTLEFNNLSGDFPAELGSLPRIERIQISDNQFSGQIPNFIQNWTKLEKLVIQASGMVRPIPSGIATLEKLTDLRISDLNGTEATFPPLSKMKMKILILRSCNIICKLPEYLGQMTTLKTLDLSFNKLSGVIPNTFSGQADADYIYLTGNLLTGPVPAWMLEKGDMITGIVPCLGSSRCQKTWYSLHINCGGKDVVADANTKYEADTDPAGPSRFFTSRTNWGFSSTGHFLDDDTPWKTYIWQNTNTSRLLTNDSELYTRARLSPISLTYYGYCLGNGNYTVNLHFAEIMFTDDNTFSSYGKCILDVYIQDFNIEDEAGAVGKAIIKRFPDAVTNSTLDIAFIGLGKEQLVSLTEELMVLLYQLFLIVLVDFIPPPENGSSSCISVGTAVGFVAGAVVALILVAGILWWKGCLRPKSTLERENGNLMELVDSRLGSDFNKEEVMVMINVALLCTDVSPTVRPTMSSVVSMLEGRAAVPDSVADSTVTTDDTKFEAFRNYYQSGRDHTKTSN
ncbi:hypothetical protein Pint_04826 [Pistacia integerrima]|uniref:Uncharacterized protein n=1 Tax=Pistacia integerrima TaxID=434235 RepID=A0ACC0Z5N5_9ROSI|nr:hypothetical protein Pint_04826 [Pistacia integerrima]